ncbi:GNAT family N-acetyltransferase [Cryobacterium sp. 1639]|uniref:GNAT family N-acetyltransferase n=1 Tax=Cryobacterium inferilacus TaxID=2866629 RepID=UPI001C72FB19|nr:GNAT family protein [Cryobacterium sp. 1639]MBX0299080.1 GNAT family N-acetyltransferase [Cryobacterium sp. 1639]
MPSTPIRPPGGTCPPAGTTRSNSPSARNLGYRLTPASWGVGFASEAAAAVLAAATPSAFPVTARALAANPASVRVLDRIGLTRLWSGSGPASTALDRVVFADRPLAPDLLAAIIRLG